MWAGSNGGLVYIGITDHAQSELKDIIFVDIPPVGDEIAAGVSFCTIESIKSISDVVAPVSGRIMLINEELDVNPGIINHNPMGTWIVAVEVS